MNEGRRKISEAEAQKLADAGKSPRFRELERLQAYFEGTQYDGRVPYLDINSNVPRLERAPCVDYRLAKAAIKSHVALALGGERFPQVLSRSSEDDSTFDDRFGLSPEDSETLDAFNSKLIELCGLQAAFRQAMRMGMASRSVALVVCFRAGLPTLDPVWAKLCTPTFAKDDPTRVVKLEIRYRYVDHWQDALATGGEWWPIVKEYRRVIDDKTDAVFVEKEIWHEKDLLPSETPAVVVKHGYGFCPVHWYARQRPSMAVGTYDGQAVHENMFAELDGVNHALSGRHLAAIYTGDPLLTATGVDPGESLGPMGRTARAERVPGSEKTGWDRAMYGEGANGAIRKGPGELWRTPNADAKIGYVTLPPGALDALSDHTDDLCSKTREQLSYVWIDPEKLTGSGDVSGKTLAFVFSSQTSQVDEDREDFGRNCIRPALTLTYRVLVAVGKTAGVWVPGLARVLPILQRFDAEVEGGSRTFMAPHLDLKYGDYFPPSDIDESTRVSTAKTGKEAGFITKKTAVEHVKGVFAIGNVDQYVEQLDQEAEDNARKMLENAQAMAKAGGGEPDGDEAQDGPKGDAEVKGAPPAAVAKPKPPKRGLAVAP